jgi:hypothetical protein
LKQMLNLPIDVITHLQNQDNMSAYVARLVRQDKQESFEDRVKRIIKQVINYVPTPAINDDINNSIKGILNL